VQEWELIQDYLFLEENKIYGNIILIFNKLIWPFIKLQVLIFLIKVLLIFGILWVIDIICIQKQFLIKDIKF